jgi:hypothetical protein
MQHNVWSLDQSIASFTCLPLATLLGYVSISSLKVFALLGFDLIRDASLANIAEPPPPPPVLPVPALPLPLPVGLLLLLADSFASPKNPRLPVVLRGEKLPK